MVKYCCIFFIASLLACTAFTQATQLNYTIAPWYQNKKAAVSLTFDDAVNGQFTVALPLLERYGFTGTFFLIIKLIPSQLGGWNLIKQAASAGNEIANHTLTHPHLHLMSADSIAIEYTACNDSIIANIPSQKSITMAYPYGDGGNQTDSEKLARSIAQQYFVGARATRNQPLPYNIYNFATTDDDYYKVNSDMIADSASMASFGNHLDETIQAGGWYVPTYHGIENGWIITPKKVFEKHLQELAKRKDSLWVSTFADALKYHRERNCAKLIVVKEDNHSWQLTLQDTLNNTALYNHPLTINLAKPSWPVKTVSQNGKNIPFTINSGWLIFNAMPGNSNIIITKG